ncbi:acyl carrier protein [Streptomyces kronopolitis]|uniref:acyl carrier protein n=1 Tax=Streptomyces kronopolitis TaxID=1612435 RepID=UPI00343DE44B
MMQFTEDDLKRILRTGAGVAEGVDLDAPNVMDSQVSDLGYDSLAMLELANRIEREYDVVLSDGDLEHTCTPREIVAHVNALLTEARV